MPPTKKGKAESTRIEYRAPDPACNPYLAFSRACSPPASTGIEEGYELPAEATANLYELTAEERAGRGHRARCPQSLSDALDAMERLRAGAPRRSASTSSSGSSATSGPSGPTTRRRSRQFELDRYLPNL